MLTFFMPRTGRKHSGTGIYHVMLRGINRQGAFEDPEDHWEDGINNLLLSLDSEGMVCATCTKDVDVIPIIKSDTP